MAQTYERTYDLAVLIGSLRKDSLNRKLARAMIELAPASLEASVVDIGRLSLYDQDLDDNPPEAWRAFRDRIKAADALLFVTPEYNRSIPAPLKNAIDVGSRPYGQSAWNGKPSAVISASPGAIGGFGANHHLRQCLVYLNAPAMQQPEAYVGGADKLFDASGALVNDSTREFLRAFMQAFAAWVEINAETRSAAPH
jgi:chromate reductase